MDSFESLSGLVDLVGVGGFSPANLPAAQYHARRIQSYGCTNPSDYLVPDSSESLNLEEVPSFDMTDFGVGDDLLSKVQPSTTGVSVADLSVNICDEGVDVCQGLAAFLQDMTSSHDENVLPNLPAASATSPQTEMETGTDEEGEELPYGWDDEMLEMTTPQLNKCIARRGLSKEEGKCIKIARRRLKNRCYAKVSRKRRLHKQAALADDHEEVSSRSQALNQEVAALRKTNEVIERRLAAFTAMLVNSGKMNNEDVQRFMAQSVREQ